MSWMKRRGHTTPSPAPVPPVQMFSPNQHSKQENQWQRHDLNTPATNWYNQVPQNQHSKQYGYDNQPPQQPLQQQQQQQHQANFWQPYNQQQYKQAITSQYQPQYGQHGAAQNQPQQQAYYPPGGEFQQQNLANDQYTHHQNQQYDYGRTQNNTYGQQTGPKPEGDSWNWGWGDEDNSNVQALSQIAQNSNANINQVANNITDSFANEESWNWSLDDTTSSTSTQNMPKVEHSSATTSHTSLDSYQPQQNVVQNAESIGGDQVFQRMGQQAADKHRKTPVIETVLDHQANKNFDQAQALLVKRGKMDHLTPQWSIESQLSQESSDDVLQTSESDKILSRSSTISQSPISGHDVENVTQLLQDVQQSHNVQDVRVKHEPTDYEEENLAPSVRQHENKENLVSVKQEVFQDVSVRGNPTPTPPMVNQTPPPQLKNHTPPLLPMQGSLDDSKNPYKRTTGLTHKAANKFRASSITPPENKPHNFYQLPSFPQFTQSVNLETLPDNSEQPDSLPIVQTSLPNLKLQKTPSHQLPENNEVAPINERNQYLETGQLSDESTNQLQIENVDTLPPPGLRRMVLGQMESNDGDLNLQREITDIPDEPPPGISRIVLGQTESSSSSLQQQHSHNQADAIGPPVGLHRMVPGESSSPESSSRPQYQSMNAYHHQDDRRNEDYNSEVEMNQISARSTRSATIGADTPPIIINPVNLPPANNTNRSETIGADLNVVEGGRLVNSSSSESRVGAVVGLDNKQQREDGLIGASANKSENRRESIEGQPQDTEINNLVSGVRDLTVAGTDVGLSSNDLQGNRRSRHESTDSEREGDRNKSPRERDRKERRYREKEERRDKPRDRYSPDSYRDNKRYDRRRYRDNRYEEDTDYYSDKERDRRRDDRDKRVDYDKKYSSLRRDKEKDKRRRDPRDYERRDGRGRGADFYYSRYENEYDDVSRSRPSSRSDSLHESYRERAHDRDGRKHRERERDHHRRHRDPFGQYMQGYGYDPYSSYYQQYHYQYYENLRRTNPQAYAEWYRKYYQQAGGQAAGAFGAEDRASVHSGRSSANDELKERYLRQNYYSHSSLPHVGGYYREPHSLSGQYGMDESSYGRPFDATDSSLMLDDTNTQSQRLTPAKFATAHVKASISSGHLVKVLPHYPLDGQSASVEIVGMQHVLPNDDEIKELVEFPGPLIKGVTHKKTIIEYCENKIRNASYDDGVSDPESYVLMWELMILLIRQNGMVVGTDIAELLMKDRNLELNFRPSSVTSNASSAIIEANTLSEASNVQTSEAHNSHSASAVLKEEFITNKFREYLLYGSGKEALEWAMKHGLWGHALFLASKLDKRTYATVMMRFANGLTLNDPLQTLYQLLSGRLPAAVTCVVDEKWGDWRPHLAMILSNTTSRPELDRKAITTLADTLLSRGSLYAAQFCYLMAEVGFSRLGSEDAKLVLLGSAQGKPFEQFATNEAIHLTELYEYACSLNDPAFIIPEFQPYKYLIATRLSDRGLLEKSLAYLERVSLHIIQNPSASQPSLIDRVCKLADRLKYNDLIGDADEVSTVEGDVDISRPDNSWLKDLKLIQSDYHTGIITHESVDNLIDGAAEVESLQHNQLAYEQQSQLQDAWQQQQQQLNDQQYQQQNNLQSWQSKQYVDQTPDNQQKLPHQDQQVLDGYNSRQYQQQEHYWDNQQQWVDPAQSSLADQYNQQQTESQLEHQQQPNNYWNNAHTEDLQAQRPQITIPNQSQSRSAFDVVETTPSKQAQQKKESPTKTKTASPLKDKQATTGWFGGIWSRLALRPKNQMKLPDDKNPTIVWDPEKKKWVNLEEDGTETSAEVKPPPKMSEMPRPKLAGGAPGTEQEQITYHQQPAVPMSNPYIYDLGQNSRVQQESLHNQVSPYGSAPAHNLHFSTGTGKVPANADEAPQQSAQRNMFKLQRTRNIKNSYIDVFNPGGKSTGSAPSLLPAPDSFGGTPSLGGTQMNYFVPAPVSDPDAPTDFLTPAPVNSENQPIMYQQPQ